jgi:hypothetical protein
MGVIVIRTRFDEGTESAEVATRFGPKKVVPNISRPKKSYFEISINNNEESADCDYLPCHSTTSGLTDVNKDAHEMIIVIHAINISVPARPK